jgi:hypothetical protein
VECECHCRWTRRRESDRSSHSCSWRADTWERRSSRRGRRRSRRRMTRTRRPTQLLRSSPKSVRQIDRPPTPRLFLPPHIGRRLLVRRRERQSRSRRALRLTGCARASRRLAPPVEWAGGSHSAHATCMAPLESPPQTLAQVQADAQKQGAELAARNTALRSRRCWYTWGMCGQPAGTRDGATEEA